MKRKIKKAEPDVTWEDAIAAFKNAKGNGRVAKVPRYRNELEPFDAEFLKLVRAALKRNMKKWTKVYQRIDGAELVAARYRVAMALPHQGGRKLLAEKYAQMEFLYGIFHYIEKED